MGNSVKTRNWNNVKAQRLSPDALARVSSRVQAEVQELTLKALREQFDITQVQLAKAANMTQPELSRLEARSDHRLSTLRRYVRALGGEVEITAVVGGRRFRLADV
jgi:predicted transcriptional regulator